MIQQVQGKKRKMKATSEAKWNGDCGTEADVTLKTYFWGVALYYIVSSMSYLPKNGFPKLLQSKYG